MHCQLCGQTVQPGSTNPNICKSCAVALGGVAAPVANTPPAPVQPNSNFPAYLRSNLPSAASSPEPTTANMPKFFNANPPQPVNSSVANPTPKASPFDAVAACSGCGNSFAVSQLYKVKQRSLLPRQASTRNMCASCTGKLQNEWQKAQNINSNDTALAVTVGLVAGIGLSLGWAWIAAATFQVAVFLIILIGWAISTLILRILGQSKGPKTAVIAGSVTLITLILAFYFLYSELGGSVVANWHGFTDSLQKNGLPWQTVAYFLIGWLVAIGRAWAFEPDILDAGDNRLQAAGK